MPIARAMPGGRAGLGAVIVAAASLTLGTAGLLAAASGTSAPVAPTATVAATDPAAGSVAGRVAVSPVIVDLQVLPRKPKAKSLVEVAATATNLSAARLGQVALSIVATPASVVIKPAAMQQLRNLQPGRAGSVTWTLCSITGGTFRLVATATAGAATTATKALTVVVPATARC